MTKQTFADVFGRAPTDTFFSPGRLNLLGEHTDYNGGLVLPAAVHLGNRFEIAPRDDHRLRVYSDQFDEMVEFDLDSLPASKRAHWSDYFAGVLIELSAPGKTGFDIGVFSTLPTGSGLSSSASITVGLAYLLNEEWKLGKGLVELSLLAQRVENNYIGLNCGILDQLSVAFGQPGHVLHIDCTTLACHPVPFNTDRYTLLSADTGVPRSLAASHYNTRRSECEQAAALLGAVNADIGNLSQATMDDIEQCDALLADEMLCARARHIVSENARVERAVERLRDNDIQGVGALMYESHQSLSRDYAVSCPELDIMVEEAIALDGVLGAKMTGGGFGGAAVVLVESERADNVAAELADTYETRAKRESEIIECRPSAGVSDIS